MGWSYGQWVGNFYPPDTKPADYLRAYSKHLDSVEANSTFYRLPYRRTVRGWRDATPDGFVFSVKLPRTISHQNLEDADKLHAFLDRIGGLGEKLGPILIQFPSGFKNAERLRLSDFLAGLPDRNRYAVEFRSKGWFDDETYQLLRDHLVAIVNVEHPWMPTTDETTSDFVYIRWQGDRRKVKGDLGRTEKDRSEDNSRWASRIWEHLQNDLDVYGYISKFYSGHPPTDARQLMQLLT